MMFKKALVNERYSILILSVETKSKTFFALCLEQLVWVHLYHHIFKIHCVPFDLMYTGICLCTERQKSCNSWKLSTLLSNHVYIRVCQKKIFYSTLTWKTVAFVTAALKKWGNARPCSKSRRKVRKCAVKMKKKNLTWAPVIVWKRKKNRLLFGRLCNAVITSRHKMEMKCSDNGTLSSFFSRYYFHKNVLRKKIPHSREIYKNCWEVHKSPPTELYFSPFLRK